MASRNSSNNTGLRILWIPGRKRNNHKGRLDTTSKHVDYSRKQKSSEVWSLGGSKVQKDFFNSDLEPINGPSISGIIPATCAFGVEAVTENNKMITETAFNKSLGDNHEDNPALTIEKSQSGPTSNEERELIQYSNDQTLVSSNKKPRNDNNNHQETLDNLKKKFDMQNGINSIESITDANSKHLSINELDDSIDGSLYVANSRKDITKKSNDDEDKEEDSKFVDCMYYTLMCCECTIS